MPNPESPPEKPWAILGINRKQYAAASPWKKAGMTKENEGCVREPKQEQEQDRSPGG